MPAASEPTTHLGAAIRTLREQEYPSQGALRAALAEIGFRRSQATLSNWEIGSKVPEKDEMWALVKVLDAEAELFAAYWADCEDAFQAAGEEGGAIAPRRLTWAEHLHVTLAPTNRTPVAPSLATA